MVQRQPRIPRQEDEFEDRVVRIDRTRKTVAGGRVFSSRAVVVVGDRRGRVGLGIGKARNAPDAVAKARERAKRAMIRVPLDGYTIPHQVVGKCGAAEVLLKPASRGTGIVAGGAVRQIIEVSGIRDVLTKSLGEGTVFNRARATFDALRRLENPAEVAASRGKSVEELLGRRVVDPYYTADAEEAAATAAVPEAEEEEEDTDGDS